MMSTYDGTAQSMRGSAHWMLFPAGWSRRGDWPDLAASAALAPLLVQYLLDDAQFTVAGMRGRTRGWQQEVIVADSIQDHTDLTR